jgi:uncharacterized damage-inducible protein DinB
MKQGLHDITRHNSWATAQVLGFCRELDSAMLNATVPGTYGTILDLLRHIIASEASYLSRAMTGKRLYIWGDHEQAVGLDQISAEAAKLSVQWETFIAGEIDYDAEREGYGDDGAVFAVPVEIFIAQAIHHANEHRAHICTILGAHGIEPPDVSVWGYGMATGRETMKVPPRTGE